MSNKPRQRVRKVDTDPRVERSTSLLGHALIELIQEHDFDEITVQQILERSGIGRTTFYAHYRNKEDVLHSSFEHLFTAFDGWLAHSPQRERLFPVTEFLAHLGTADSLADALRRAGKLEEFWSFGTAAAARCIESRIGEQFRSDDSITRQLVARMLAGALVESINWWRDHRDAATPAQMELAFHEFARGVLARAT